MSVVSYLQCLHRIEEREVLISDNLADMKSYKVWDGSVSKLETSAREDFKTCPIQSLQVKVRHKMHNHITDRSRHF